jgi:putative membrane protein
LQSVDLIQPLVARLFGLSELRVEVAGGGDSRIAIQYLRQEEANRLRNEILARAAGIRPDAGAAAAADLAIVPPKELFVSLLLRVENVSLLLLTAAIMIPAYLAGGFGALAFAAFTGGLPLLAVAGEFTRFFNFTVSESADGLRLRHGLTQTEQQTVPPGRVQAVEFVEPLLWRRKDWVRVRLNVAGLEGSAKGDSNTERVLIPVAPWPVALGLVDRFLPTFDLAEIQWASADSRSRWLAPFSWRNLAVGVTDDLFLIRSGWLVRRIAIIPHVRTQSVQVSQGPVRRLLGLANVRVDATPGPVEVQARSRNADEARQLVFDQAARAADARAKAGPERWLANWAELPAVSDPAATEDQG